MEFSFLDPKCVCENFQADINVSFQIPSSWTTKFCSNKNVMPKKLIGKNHLDQSRVRVSPNFVLTLVVKLKTFWHLNKRSEAEDTLFYRAIKVANFLSVHVVKNFPPPNKPKGNSIHTALAQHPVFASIRNEMSTNFSSVFDKYPYLEVHWAAFLRLGNPDQSLMDLYGE